MAYRKRTHISAKLAAARQARDRARMSRPAPDYPPALPHAAHFAVQFHKLFERLALTAGLGGVVDKSAELQGSAG